MRDWLRRHFRKHARRRPWDFCWRTSLEGLLVSFAVVIPLSLIISEETREMVEWPAGKIIAAAILFAPLFETLLLQALPISIARALKAKIHTQIIISTLIFALLHFPEGIAVGIGAGVIGGWYFAFAYARWARRSFWTALWVTTVAHLIRNVIAVSMMLLTR
jgi:hypothetical protein